MNLTIFDGFYNDSVIIVIYSSESVVYNETVFLNGTEDVTTGKIMFQKTGTHYLSLLENKNSLKEIGSYSPLYVTAESDLFFINVLAIPSTVSSYEQFRLQCNLTNRCGEPVVGKILNVSSTNLRLFGTLTVLATESIVNFLLYAEITGSFKLNVTSGSAFGITSINIIPNSIKFISISSNVFII